MDGGIPEEAWIGKKVNYSFLKTFSCEAFSHIDKENRTKIEAIYRSVHLLEMDLTILVITYGIMNISKSLGINMWYSMKCHVQRSSIGKVP